MQLDRPIRDCFAADHAQRQCPSSPSVAQPEFDEPIIPSEQRVRDIARALASSAPINNCPAAMSAIPSAVYAASPRTNGVLGIAAAPAQTRIMGLANIDMTA